MSPDDSRAAADRARFDAEDANLAEFETQLAAALCSSDPAAARRSLGENADVQALIRGGIQHLSEDGFRIASLLIARLRFERLSHGSRAAGAAFAHDPRAFAEQFRRYHAAVPCSATTPTEEAALFEAWLSA